jgi:hypothetical protein
MKSLCFLLGFVWTTVASALAEVQMRVSIKVILGPGDAWPSNNAPFSGGTALNLNSETVIRDNFAFINSIVSNHGTCYRFVLREDTIYTLSGFAGSWFTRSARTDDYRRQLEEAATVDANSRAIWKWHDDSINIYINNSSSGSSEFPGNRSAITIGAGGYNTLILHEIGHFLGLLHTHTTADGNESDTSVDDWGNGDLSDATLDDDKDATAAQINDRYDGIPAGTPFFPQSVRDDLIFNLMSYHLPQDRFVWEQKDVLITNFNNNRAYCTTGRARFVQTGGNDGASGLSVTDRLATIGRGVNLSISPNDVVMIHAGTYNAGSQGLPLTITQPLTLGAWRGPVTITR